MNDIVLSIILSVIASAVYSLLVKIISAIRDRKQYKPQHEKVKIIYTVKRLRCQFFITAAVIVTCFITLINVDISSLILKSIIQVIFFIALFMLWSAFECMAEIYNQCIDIIKNQSTDNCGNDNHHDI